MLSRFRAFNHEVTENGLLFAWQLGHAVLRAHVNLLPDGLSFRLELSGPGAAHYSAVEYPVLDGLQSRGNQSYLAHAYATGLLIQDPLKALPSRGGLRFCPYPESFSGASMQLMAYYHPKRAGLCLMALDGQGHQKWLNAYKKQGKLRLSHMYGCEELGGEVIRQPYDFVIRLYDGSGWEQAADLYRAFAHQQPWCEKGRLWDRRSSEDWLHEDVGYCSFGVNAGHDRSRWLRRYARDIGTPGFHVLGPDWTNKPQTFGSGVPGGMADWLPTRFSGGTLAAIRRQGDRFAPFEFDFLVALDQSDRERLKDNLQLFPHPSLSHDAYRFTMLCPCQPFTRAFHRDRDLQVHAESACDAMYYDISANNLIKLCMRNDHEHRMGGGAELTEGYRRCYEETAEALEKQAGQQIPLGTEMICETYLSELQFYQARAWAQPCSTLETWPFLKHMRSSQARMIPLFEHVYHEYGAVRMDGWGKLVRETGDLYYHNVAKVYLWGGLYELNHEYSPMEALDGEETKAEEHYFRFDPQGYAYDPARAAWLSLFAKARVGHAKPYWAYGRLLATPALPLPMKEYSWYHYNHDQHSKTYKASGSYRAPAVMASLFEHPEAGFALFLANSDEQAHTLKLDRAALPRLQGPEEALLYQLKPDGSRLLIEDFRMHPEASQAVTLEALGLYMLEIIPKERGTKL